jgi:hypothetical protein
MVAARHFALGRRHRSKPHADKKGGFVVQPSQQAANVWRILFLLVLAKLFNFFDRSIAANITEAISRRWSLSDL